MPATTSDDPTPTFEQLLERHVPDLEAYVRRNMHQGLAKHESCSDLVQSVCREVLESRERFHYQGDEKFRRWLLQVALHKLIDRRRFYRASVRAEPAVAGADAWRREDLAKLARTLLSPSGEAMLREDIERLECALDELSDADRAIIRMIHLDGLTHADAGDRLGCTASQSRHRLFLALVRLSSLLGVRKK